MSGLGVSYLPPTEDVAIFDTLLYNQNNAPLTYAEALKHFLAYPVAQGTETLLNTNVVGELAINNTNNKIEFSGAGSNLLVVKRGGDIDLVATTLGTDNIVIGCGTTAGRLLANTNITTKTSNIAIGSDALQNNVATASSNVSNNVAIGSQSLRLLRGTGGASLTNTAVGTASLYNFDSGNNNYAGGYASGLELSQGNNNTFLGVSSGLNASLAGGCNNSTIIGYNAKATASNQIYLGGANTSLVIGGSVPITFETNNTKIPNGFKVNTINTVTGTTTYTVQPSWFTCITRFLNTTLGANFTVAFDNSISSDYYGVPLTITNQSKFALTFSCATAPAKSFGGRYGNGATTFQILSGGTYSFFYDGTIWNVFSKDDKLHQYNTGGSTSLGYNNLLNSTVFLNSTTTPQVIGMPQLTATADALSFNGEIIFYNQSAFTTTFTVGGSNRFTGQFGNGDGSLILQPRTSFKIIPNTLANRYEIVERSPAQGNINIAYSGVGITLRNDYVDSVINLTGSTLTTITLPTPVLTSDSVYITGRYLKIFNNGSAVITLSTPSGNFTGSHGNNQTTISLQDNTWYNLTSNGTTWDINERSSNITFTVPVSATVDYSVYYNLADATVRFTQASPGTHTITLPTPTAPQVRQTTSRYFNNSIYTMTLANTTNISGRYGSTTTTYSLPPDTFVELFSDGASYYAQERSQNWVVERFINPSSSTFYFNPQYLDSTLELTAPDDATNGSGNSITGNATQSGTTLSVLSATAAIGVGSVINFNSQRLIVLAQFTSTAGLGGGSTGTYQVSVSQTVGVSTAYTGSSSVANSGPLVSGTLSVAVYSSQTANIADVSIDTITAGANSLNAGTSLYSAGFSNNLLYLLNNANSGGVGSYKISSAPFISAVTGAGFFSTKGGDIQIPNPSTSIANRRITIINNSYTPTNIRTLSAGVVFAGQYGQQQSSAIGMLPATLAPHFLLMPSRTVVLECDGVNWNAITGTTVASTRVFGTNPTQSTALQEIVQANFSTIHPLLSYSDGLNALQSANNGTGDIVNTSQYPISLSVNVRAVWSSPVQTTGIALATRSLSIICGGALTSANNFFQPINTNINPIRQSYDTVFSQFNYVGGVLVQQLTQIIVLNYNDSFRVQIAKVNGQSGVAETITTCVITVSRLF